MAASALSRFNSAFYTTLSVLSAHTGAPKISLYHLGKVAKHIFYLLLLLNARSSPLAWHIRIFRPAVFIRLNYRWMKLRTMLMSRERREKEEDSWLDGLCPVGQDPFDMAVPYNSWASIDDSDFNLHLSNSSYAKTCDAARFKAALKMAPMFFRAGGWLALAATHYEFIREIPMFASYEVRVSIQTWDHKWLYVVLKFVTKPKRSNREQKPEHKKVAASAKEDNAPNSAPFYASLRMPADGELTIAPGTPAESVTAVPSHAETDKSLRAVSNGLQSKPKEARTEVLREPDGATLHTIAVSRLCFKLGRITVPPGLVLALNGFSARPTHAEDPSASYSHENPPPSFKKAKELMSKIYGGSPKRLREFLKGGWKEVPEGSEERWWETTLGGYVEERRKSGLAAMEKLKKGVEGSRI
ncbi:hypothetical protein AX15_002367 [Amanita polypyramis BW_CC]|nr:hypothetical protein AX15_002367 [Amanita polypyramis BW_CC]